MPKVYLKLKGFAYGGFMVVQFPENQVGRQLELWFMGYERYGLTGVRSNLVHSNNTNIYIPTSQL